MRSQGLRTLLLVVVLGLALLEAIEALGGPEGIRERFGMGAAVLLVPTQVVVSASPVPGELVAVVTVAIYGFGWGSVLCWLAWLGAGFLEYAIARRTASDLLEPSTLERLPGFLGRLPADHPTFLIVTRFLPFGAHVVNVVAGVRGVPFGRFAWTSAVALVPISVIFAALATGLLGRS